MIFNNLYKHFITHYLITKNQSGFRPGDSTTNQLIDLVEEIHQAFDSKKPFEVRTVFLNISKAFDSKKPFEVRTVFLNISKVFDSKKPFEVRTVFLNISKAFDSKEPFEVRTVFLNISKAFDSKKPFEVRTVFLNISKVFDSKKPFEVRTVFLNISKAFDKVWHEGLIFKMMQKCRQFIETFSKFWGNGKQRVVLKLMVSHLITLASILVSLSPWFPIISYLY